jgi:hypothetical protein
MARNITPGDDSAPAWLRDCRQIDVDLAGLTQFARALRDEVDLNFQPHAARIFGDLDRGAPPFDAKAGFVELTSASDTYLNSRDRALGLLQAYVQATRELAAAADEAAKNYGGSDDRSAALTAGANASRVAAPPVPDAGQDTSGSVR